MAELELLGLRHKGLVEGCLRRHPPEVSEHTFTNLFAWRHSRPITLLETEGTLFFLVERAEGLVALGPPVGRLNLRDSVSALDGIKLGRPLVAFERVPKGAIEGFDAGQFKVSEDRDNFDYVYRLSDLAALTGRRYHAKRNFVEQCLATHECICEAISPDNLQEVADMQERWCAERNCKQDPHLCDEYRAIREVLDNFWALSAFGAAIRADGTIQAYTIGEALNPSTAVIHFEKAMSSITGLYQLVNQAFCRNYLKRFEYVNREQDLGIPGLRKAKMSYHPDRMVEKYTVRFAAETGLP